ncbi:holin [Allobacillus sp. SKP2-8]|uniref:Holin n=3 Tax=Bacillaceae TaxID=186817 RepID=A0A556PM62_9BACI|nr:phage holin family protein [Allobacillus halotolerans]TSJ65482.1 holin [Allobacillus salarius]TSJ69448.1 holin [Allobacillus sp. SKP2-8]
MAMLDFIMEEAYILIPVLIIIGRILKISTNLPTRFIPITLLGLSFLLTGVMLGLSFESTIQSILIAGAAVFSHQLFKQMRNR